MEVWVVNVFYKIAQGSNLLICNELFIVGWSTILLVFQEVIIIFDVLFKKLISWPFENKMDAIMQGFKSFCALPNIQGPLTVHIFLFANLLDLFVRITTITNLEAIVSCVK
jgi:hypothetical protein